MVDGNAWQPEVDVYWRQSIGKILTEFLLDLITGEIFYLITNSYLSLSYILKF